GWKTMGSLETVVAVTGACIHDFKVSRDSCGGWSNDDCILSMKRAGVTVIHAESLDLHASARMDSSIRGHVSRLVTLGFRLKASLNPRLIGLRRRYHKLLEKHRDDHHCIEANLFVAIKT